MHEKDVRGKRRTANDICIFVDSSSDNRFRGRRLIFTRLARVAADARTGVLHRTRIYLLVLRDFKGKKP